MLKLVNTSASAQDLSVNLKGKKLVSKGTVITLKSDNLEEVNSFASPKKISPTESEFKLKGEKANITLPAYSVTVLKLKMR